MIVRHPTLDASYDVEESAAPEWAAAGWVLDEPKPAKRAATK